MAKVDVDIKKLLEAGAHFGHQTSRWHPKMASYIHSKRDGNHIIDLTKTVTALEEALNFLTETAAAGKQILLVSTKRQAQDKVKEVAEALRMPYVTVRWLGGMLTNQPTIGGRIKHLKDLETRMANGELAAKYSKLEVQRFQEEIDEMNHIYGGIKDMAVKPGAVFIVDVLTDDIPVREAKKLDVPVVALIDTNADPSLVDYPIPCNDDATKTINLILDYVKQAIEDGQAKVKKAAPAEEKETKVETKPASEAAAEETKTDEPKPEEPAKIEPVRGIG
ncbi:MAG TPA: 30S ribosomal protein S2 [Candidatus Saccharimonadales bacterium]|nr:30S ribosomal protein S2 [Candidatus Saccharimonadales bacterium]